MNSDTHIDPPPGIKLLNTLREHEQEINRISWSPDGQFLASSSFDGTVGIWSEQENTTKKYSVSTHTAYTAVWRPDGKVLAACTKDDRTIFLWDEQMQASQPIKLNRGVSGYIIYDITWVRYNNKILLASCSEENAIRIWDVEKFEPLQSTLRGHDSLAFCLAYSFINDTLASGSAEGPIRIWNTSSGEAIQVLRGHNQGVCGMMWSPDGNLLVSSSIDHTVRLWEATTWKQLRVLEQHTSAVTGISFSYDGRLLASKSQDHTVCLWRTDTWEVVAILPEIASNGLFAGIAFHPNRPILATAGERDMVVHLWELDIPYLLGQAPAQPMVHYTNAKVVLVGESGVGKTALGMVLAGKPYEKTDSTHGRIVREFDYQVVDVGKGQQEQRETFLWDLAGQIGYRPIHQLHFAEVAVALIVFSNSQLDPFTTIPHWARALSAAQNVWGNAATLLKKILVEARVDRGRVNVSSEEIQKLMMRWGLDEYIDTSALEGRNIAELRAMIQRVIDWNALPKVTSTELFQRIKAFLVAQKETESILATRDTLYRTFLHVEGMPEMTTDVSKEFNTCIGLIESQGLIRRLSFGGLILLQPELLDAYASALVNVARDDSDNLGSVAETAIRTGDFAVPLEVRIADKEQEKLLLLAMVEDLLTYEIALREQSTDGAYLVFPLEVTRPLTDLSDPQGKTVVFGFEGPVLNIYVTLAVRLSHSGIFTKREMWQNAVTYRTPINGLCGIALRDLRTIEEGRGELTLFFDNATSEETRFQFEDYIRTHLERYILPGSLRRQRVFRCSDPACQVELTEKMVSLRRQRGYNWLDCPVCGTRIDLRDHLERFAQEQEPASLVQEIDRSAKANIKRETAQVVVQGKIETRDFDVFLCHNANDISEVKAVGTRLKEQGLLPWLDEWELRPGLPWQRILEEQIEHIKAAAVFVGQSGMGPWQLQELEALLRQFVNRRCPVIPVVLATASECPQLPLFLQGMTWVNFREENPDPLQRLIWGITGEKPPLL